MTNAAARPGDLLVLTKPLGTGVITTGIKRGLASPALEKKVVALMSRLNTPGADLAEAGLVKAATDITGFGLVGHAHEMAERSDVAIEIRASAVPLLPGARAHAERGISFGGLERNQAHFDDGTRVRFAHVDPPTKALMLDPQTSGGLLVGVPSAHADAWTKASGAHGVRAVEIGVVRSGSGVAVV
jgi:selenide,water dikinase